MKQKKGVVGLFYDEPVIGRSEDAAPRAGTSQNGVGFTRAYINTE